jgi:hypothetical protein
MAGMSATDDNAMPDLSDPDNKLEWLLLEAALVHIGMGGRSSQFIDRAMETFAFVETLLADREDDRPRIN